MSRALQSRTLTRPVMSGSGRLPGALGFNPEAADPPGPMVLANRVRLPRALRG